MTINQLIKILEKRRQHYADMKKTPLVVSINLKSPVMSAIPWLAFDSLLSYSVMIDVLQDDFHNWFLSAQETPLDVPLPLVERSNRDNKKYFCASFHVLKNESSIVRWKRNWCGEHDDFVNFNGKRERIQTDGLFFKNKDLPGVIWQDNPLIFYVLGNHTEIERLFSFVSSVGQRRGAGYGKIQDVSVVEHEHDWSCWKNKKPTRPIPVDDTTDESLPVQVCGYRSPYWMSKLHSLCVIPS